jgi:hypothetical protein
MSIMMTAMAKMMLMLTPAATAMMVAMLLVAEAGGEWTAAT